MGSSCSPVSENVWLISPPRPSAINLHALNSRPLASKGAGMFASSPFIPPVVFRIISATPFAVQSDNACVGSSGAAPKAERNLLTIHSGSTPVNASRNALFACVNVRLGPSWSRVSCKGNLGGLCPGWDRAIRPRAPLASPSQASSTSSSSSFISSGKVRSRDCVRPRSKPGSGYRESRGLRLWRRGGGKMPRGVWDLPRLGSS